MLERVATWVAQADVPEPDPLNHRGEHLFEEGRKFVPLFYGEVTFHESQPVEQKTLAGEVCVELQHVAPLTARLQLLKLLDLNLVVSASRPLPLLFEDVVCLITRCIVDILLLDPLVILQEHRSLHQTRICFKHVRVVDQKVAD